MESCAFNILLPPSVGANLRLAVLEVALSVALVHADAGDVGFLAALRGSLGVRKYVARAPAAKRSTYKALQRFFHKSCLLCCRFEQRWVLLARCYYLALLYFGYPGLVVLFYRSHPTLPPSGGEASQPEHVIATRCLVRGRYYSSSRVL